MSQLANVPKSTWVGSLAHCTIGAFRS